jgi:hypothetical protein
MWKVTALRLISFCQQVMNSTHQLPRLRSSINQCYIGEQIHQICLLRLYFYVVQANGVRSEMKKKTPVKYEYECEYVPERPVIIYFLFTKSKSPEPCSTCDLPAHKIVFWLPTESSCKYEESNVGFTWDKLAVIMFHAQTPNPGVRANWPTNQLTEQTIT